MVGGSPSLAPQSVRNLNAVPDYPGNEADLDLEAVLPLELIREHTKTDDTPSVTDAQLSLYRQAAFESCEQYTGMLFTRSQIVRESVQREGHRTRFRTHRRITLRYAPLDPVVYLYGGGMLQPLTVNVVPGEKAVRIPVVQEALDASSCCRPCSLGGENFGIMIMYRAGIGNARGVPALIKTGCLKFIAWAVNNPGDTIMTVKNRTSAGEAGIVGTNNGAWASGAIEDWRQLVPDAT